VVLDIDGVFVKGSHVIKGGQEALKKLQKAKIPYVFVTNGGGWLESVKAKDLEKKLGVKVREDTVCVSHTPFRELAKEYADKRVLVLGHEGCEAIARQYGFTRVVTAHQLHAETPTLYPRKPKLPSSATATTTATADKDVAAVFIIHDPLDWALEMQVCLDLLFSEAGKAQAIPLYACNADLVYNTEHPTPRLTQGAFVEGFRHLYELRTQTPLSVHYCGKPFSVTYRIAEAMLAREAARLKAPAPTVFVGIGDNPVSDIRGARNAGPTWSSILVSSPPRADSRRNNNNNNNNGGKLVLCGERKQERKRQYKSDWRALA
jgi:HAD superfamily hydrolase (TIGR01456 family)